jgi:hypothetical protein
LCSRPARTISVHVPHPFAPHYDDWKGYTFPIVCELLDQIGLPEAIREIPPPYQDELAATFAISLAHCFVYFVVPEERKISALQRKLWLLDKHGSREYLEFKRTEKQVLRRYSAVLSGLNQLEKEAQSRTYSASICKRLAVARRNKTVLLRQADAVWLKREKLESIITSSPQYIQDATRNRPFELRPSIDETFVLSIGTDFLRYGSHARWWKEIRDLFASRVAYDRSRAPHKIALRKPHVIVEIMSVGHKTTLDGGAFEHLFTVLGKECVKDLRIDAIHGTRQVLREEDSKGFEWLHHRHRYNNFYTRWLSSLECNPPADLDTKWLQAITDLYSNRCPERPSYWYSNELTWCFAHVGGENYPFTPAIPASSSHKKWEAHLHKWLAAIESKRRELK